MSDVMAFAKRNCLAYFRDKAAVFFSLLGVLIVVLLYLIFLRSMLIDSIVPKFEGISNVDHLVDAWVLSGIMGIVSVTTSAGALQIMVQDKVDGKFRDTMMTSMSPAKITAGYVLSTFLVGAIMSLITLVISVVYLLITGCTVSFVGVILSILLVIPASLSSSIIIYALTAKIKSPGAFSGFFTVVSVLIGFLAGIYMPIGTMEKPMQVIGNLVPASHMASLFREALSGDMLNSIFSGLPQSSLDQFKHDMGYTLCIGSFEFTPLTSLIYVFVITLVFFLIAVYITKKQ